MSLDYPEWIDSRQQRSRKLRFCCECRGPILAGQIYQYIVGRWDGNLSDFQICLACLPFRDQVDEPIFGDLDEAIRESGDAPLMANWRDHCAQRRRDAANVETPPGQ